jgi:hypothetical protein
MEVLGSTVRFRKSSKSNQRRSLLLLGAQRLFQNTLLQTLMSRGHQNPKQLERDREPWWGEGD